MTMIQRLACIVLLLSGFLVPAAEKPLPKLDLGNVREEHLMIPMRDGTRLSAYVYFPPGAGPWPTIFEQRYAVINAAPSRKELAALAAHGYVAARVNFRGAQLSEGRWVGYRALAWGELRDGYDLCEWFAAQSWSTGKVGTFGGSQGGFAQNFLAVTAPPHLVCQYMTDTGLSLFQEGYRLGGMAKPERFKKMDTVARDAADNRALMAEWYRHQTYDDYWRAEDCSLHFGKMNVPCFTIGSWYDFMSQGSLASFVGRQHHGGKNSRGQQQLLVGPWLHGGNPKSNKIGEMVYPENAKFDTQAHMLRWFDHFLKGVNNGVEKEPPVRYYVMGAVGEPGAPGNEWRMAKDWPVSAKETSYYLHGGGGLSTERGGATLLSPSSFHLDNGGDKSVAAPPATSYVSDPKHPMEIPFTAFPGATDARKFEAQKEVRTFTTAPLAAPVEWTGKLRAELFVSSTARDTDFIVRVSDVYPDGRSILIADYVRRARYREGFEREVLMTPGKIYRVAFDIGSLSQIFNAGHRIRITVASTGAPFYEPNPQTGEPLAIEFPVNAVLATNTVFHQRNQASRVIAPVISANPNGR
ncbi:MAG: CocE/NonD family hydrolase [Verrucomicrobia bacterium]|nr:CocE/NonD family hydrolase [Verrucomicrobiota bacterium]